MSGSGRLPGRRRAGRRGQAMIESVMAVLLLSLILFALLQVGYLYIAQMITDHTAFVMGRSHAVGFNRRLVRRAMEVGSIGMAGHIVTPAAYTDLPPRELGAMEPLLIQEFLSTNDYTMYYQHWDRLAPVLPLWEHDQVETYRVNVNEYPLDMPMSGAYVRNRAIDFHGQAELLNHAAHYLEGP